MQARGYKSAPDMQFEPIITPSFADSRLRLGDYLPRLVKADIEMLAIIHLGARGEIIARRINSSGALGSVMVPLRQVVCDALNLGSLSILLAHNHPSGDATPSSSDIHQTQTLLRIFKPLDIEIEYHLIVTRGGVMSMRGLGLV